VSLGPLLQKTLILVAHPDDEAIGCGALLQRIKQPLVVFATAGVPQDPYFWQPHGSPAQYAAVRHQEALAALAEVGVTHCGFLGFEDQRLFLQLEPALASLNAVIRDFRPEALLTHTYEGGHPDHDACAFLCHEAAKCHGIPVWEMPLYQRATGRGTIQTFISGEAGISLDPTPQEIHRKRAMIARYASQGLTTSPFDPAREIFRLQPDHDFSKPPHAGKLNYEAWQWSMTGQDVCRAFVDFRLQHRQETVAGCR